MPLFVRSAICQEVWVVVREACPASGEVWVVRQLRAVLVQAVSVRVVLVVVCLREVLVRVLLGAVLLGRVVLRVLVARVRFPLAALARPRVSLRARKAWAEWAQRTRLRLPT
ncbi:hypothetical protein CLOM_g437 [Closterium sp. NIES-68]|nr:hypothetical protein CLOM_g437 [Closterium sp. NIES-68]